jgi:hypothetical protein
MRLAGWRVGFRAASRLLCVLGLAAGLTVMTGRGPSAWADGFDDRTFIGIWPEEGPPTTRVLVHGRGFCEHEEVWIYFDYAMQVVTVTDDDGEFSDVGFMVSGRETPGLRTVTAVGQECGKFDQVAFKIRNGFQFNDDKAGQSLIPCLFRMCRPRPRSAAPEDLGKAPRISSQHLASPPGEGIRYAEQLPHRGSLGQPG